MEAKFLVFAALLQLSTGKPVSGFPLQYPAGKVFQYAYTTETAINELTADRDSSQAKKDVGFKFTASIEFAPVWQNNKEFLVKLTVLTTDISSESNITLVSKPRLHSVARPSLSRELRGLPRLPVYFQWREGRVGRVWAAEDDSLLAVNIKKGIISLFQLKVEDGTHQEIDASGECDVSYIKDGNIVKRIKTGCSNIETKGQFSNVNPIFGVSVTSQSQTTYHINSDDVIESITGFEEYQTTLNMEESLASTVKIQQELKFISARGGVALQGDDVDQVVHAISKGNQYNLYGMILGTTFEPLPSLTTTSRLHDLLSRHRKDFLPEHMARVETAKAFLELVSTLRAAPGDVILELLRHPDNTPIVGALIDAVVAAQTTPAQKALMDFLDFREEYYIENQERYLLAAAFTTHPTAELITDLLALYKSQVPSAKLRESIGEAMGAVVNTFCGVPGQCDAKVINEVIQAMVEALEGCEEEHCKPMTLHALANAAVPGTVTRLLTFAENAKDAVISEAAIKALRRIDRKYISREVLDVMKRIFHQRKRAYDSAVRTRALNVILENAPTQAEIREIVVETADPDNTEFDMFVQARLFNLMKQDEKIRQMVEEALTDPIVNNWHILAPAGKSLAFTNVMAETPTVTASYFMHVQNSKAHIMKRSGMDVTLASANQTKPVYSIGIFAAGLEGLLGKEVEAGQEEAVATAGLAMDLLDVSLRPITFFTGQGGLMSAVWNAPSEPISALQVNLLLNDHLERIHLQNGLIVELDIRGCLSMDLSGSLSISLWNKNAKSQIKNTGAMVIQGSTNIVTSPFSTGITYTGDATAVINFNSDVDFYDTIKTCLQMSRPEFVFRHTVNKFEHARGFQKGYSAHIRRQRHLEAVSFPLPPANAAQCRALMAS